MSFGGFMSEPRGRYEQVDSQDENLPEGTERIGYDADTEEYTFRNSDGSWFVRPKHANMPINQKAKLQDYRYMAPFVLIVVVVLMFLFRYVNSGTTISYSYSSSSSSQTVECFGDLERYTVEESDTCWAIAEKHDTTVDGLHVANIGLDCDHLWVGSQVCVPKPGTSLPEMHKEPVSERPGFGGPAFKCYQITCMKDYGGDEQCAREGCGKGCSAQSNKCVS